MPCFDEFEKFSINKDLLQAYFQQQKIQIIHIIFKAAQSWLLRRTAPPACRAAALIQCRRTKKDLQGLVKPITLNEVELTIIVRIFQGAGDD